jgi:hypothetical protein
MELLQHLVVIAVAWFIVSILTAVALGRWLALQDQRAMRAQPRQVPLDATRSVLPAARPAMREAECSTPRRSRRAKLMQRIVAVTHH